MEVLDESSATTWRVVNVIKEVCGATAHMHRAGILSTRNFPYVFLHTSDTYFFFRNAQKVDTQLMKP